MQRVVTEPLSATESRKVDFDFAPYVPVGVTISSADATSSVYSGTDSTPDITGTPTISGTVVTVPLSGGTEGVIYDVVVAATLSDTQIVVLASYVAVVPA